VIFSSFKFYEEKMKREFIDNTRYTFIYGSKKLLKYFGREDYFIFRSPKSLFEVLEKMDFSKYSLGACIVTATLNDAYIESYGMRLSKEIIPTKIFYVDTNFELRKDILMKHFSCLVFGEKFYYSKKRLGIGKQNIFVIVFSHGICVHCDVEIFEKEDSIHLRNEVEVHDYQLRNFYYHIKNIIMNELKCTNKIH
jgi:hypothetical protein